MALAVGAIVGIVAGSVGGLVIVTLIIWFLCNYRSEKRPRGPRDNHSRY